MKFQKKKKHPDKESSADVISEKGHPMMEQMEGRVPPARKGGLSSVKRASKPPFKGF